MIPTLEVKCHICGSAFSVSKYYYDARVKKGKTLFACPTKEKGKASVCRRELQALTIAEVRSTPESKAKTSAQMKAIWADPLGRDKINTALQAGMAASDEYMLHRGAKIAAAKALTPELNSAAMRRAWDTRGRPEWKMVTFTCANHGCNISVEWELPPAQYRRFLGREHHFCGSMCGHSNATVTHDRAEMGIRNCLLCSAEIIKPESYFKYYESSVRGFYCSTAHQKKFLSLYGLPESAIAKIKEFRSTQVFATSMNGPETAMLPVLESLGFRFVGNNAVRIGSLNPDFINDETRTVAEHYGCWWHFCPQCHPGREEVGQRTARFGYRDAVFHAAGYKHVWLWGHEIEDNPVGWQDVLRRRVADAATVARIQA